MLLKRRETLKWLLGVGSVLPTGFVGVAPDVRQQRGPQENDLFVFAFGDREGHVIRPADPILGHAPIVAYPMEPGTNLVRDASRLNRILLIRLDPASLSASTRAGAVDGIVAYSAVCTHTGCDIEDWSDETGRLQCPCHESQFDPADGARVVGGPAPRRLAALPLKLVDRTLMAASGFRGRVGFQQP